MEYDVNYFIEALERLNFKMINHEIEKPLQIYVIGGFCMMLHGLREATIDIDSYLLDRENGFTHLKSLIDEVGVEIGNPEWLNMDIENLDTIPSLSSLLKVADSFKEERKIGCITLYVAQLKTILLTKILAAMDERDNYFKDIQDILSIISRTGFSMTLINNLNEFSECSFDVLSTLLSILFEHKYITEAELTEYYNAIKLLDDDNIMMKR